MNTAPATLQAPEFNLSAMLADIPVQDELQALASQFLAAKRAADRAEALKAELLKAMSAKCADTVEVPGLGIVKAVAGSTRSTVDGKALAVKVGDFAAMLLAHGIEVDASLPLTIATTSAGLRVTWAK